MKKFFLIYFTFYCSLFFCQKISLKQFNKIDSSNKENVIKYLAKEITSKFKEKNKAVYYDNLFRLNIINENYNLSLSQLDSIRSLYVKNDPISTAVIGIQFEIYLNTIKRISNNSDFDKIYEEEFRKKYQKLPFKSRLIFPQYFTYNNIESLKKEVNEILTEKVVRDSIDFADALKACRRDNYYIVGKKTFGLGLHLLKKIEKENFTIYDSINIPTRNNDVLTLSVVLSNKIKNRKPESTILINTIYAATDNIDLVKEFAENGYVGVILNTRGKYLSPNSIEPFEHEAEDVNEAINWIVKQPWSNGKVGMIGGSYLGFSQWAATKNLHPALKTIVPEAPVGIGTMDFPMNNNVFASYVLRWLHYVTNTKMTDDGDFYDEKKWNSIFKKWYESGKPFREIDSINSKANSVFQQWLNHPDYDGYWQKMVPYKKEFSKIDIPVLTITGYYDSDQLGALYYFREHYKNNKDANHYLIIGPYDHSGAQGNITKSLKGYEIDPAANIDLNKIWIDWFNYTLKGKEKPDFLKNKINYQVMGTNQWKSKSSIDDFDKKKLKLYLENENNKLSLTPLKVKDNNYSSLEIDFKDRSDAEESINQKSNILDSIVYQKNGLVFSTNAFKESFELSGNFSGKIKFMINKKDVDIYANLYELMSDGKYFLLSTYLGRASYSKNNEKRNLLIPNKKETISIYNNEFVSKKIGKGSKLVLTIGIVKSPLWQINYGTGKDVSTETIADAKEPLEIKWYNDSYIEIPISEN